MANTVTIDIVADTRKLVQGVNTANQQLSGLQKSVKNVGNIAAAAGAFAVAGRGFADIARLATGAVKSSIDLADSIDAVRMTLNDKKAFNDFQTFLSTTATSLGLSKTNAAAFGAQLAGIGYGAGLGGQELEKFTEKTLQLAVDLRSKFGGSLEEALTAVKSALTGELTPLKKYGVALSDATMKQYGLSKGIIRTTKGALTPQQKTMIAYEMLLDSKVNGSVGNFADTQESAANQLQKLNAQLDDAKTTLGNAFLPGLTTVVTFINEHVIPAFQALPDPIKAFIGVAVGLGVIAGPVVLAAAAFGALGISLGTVAAAVWAIAAPVLIVIAVIAALVAIGVLLYKNWDTITRVAGEVWEGIKKAFEPIANFIKDVFTAAWEGIKPWLQLLGGIVAVIIGIFLTPFIALFNRVKGIISSALGSEAFEKFKGIIKSVISYVTKQWGQFIKTFVGVGSAIVKGVWAGISGAGTWLRDKFFKFFGDLIPGWVKKMLGIKSPSKVFMEFGNQIVKGLAIGMNPTGIRKASSGLAMGAMSGFGPAQLSGGGYAGSGIVININAGLGTDPYELGRVVQQALHKYESINGSR
jgi:phage-related protein